ncbi:hypothetical protein B9Y61_18945 [Stenotrophomonas maltophilia]|nr:hypothetical protein B9Y61_18945 [Stenotrophomonas maltophilia]
MAARNAKGKEKRYKLAAGAGLYLQVMPNGNRYWRMKYGHAGKRTGTASFRPAAEPDVPPARSVPDGSARWAAQSHAHGKRHRWRAHGDRPCSRMPWVRPRPTSGGCRGLAWTRSSRSLCDPSRRM